MIGEKLIEKLWDTAVKDGIGSLFIPWHVRRMGKANADARRDELLLLAQTEKDVNDIKSGIKQYTPDRKLINAIEHNTEQFELSIDRIEPTFNLEKISANAQNRIQANKIQEEINITKTILFAEEELELNPQEGSDEPIDNDWFTRWRDSAEKINSEQLQRLWAKALAGEITNPGSYSLRTLDFIKNISKNEATNISKLAPYVIAGLVCKVPCIEQSGINFSFLLEMEDLGILSGIKGGGLGYSMKSSKTDSYENHIIHEGKIIIFKHTDPNKVMKLECYKVTTLGSEVLSLGVFPIVHEYIEQVASKIKAHGFEVTIADWVKTSKDYGNYFNERII